MADVDPADVDVQAVIAKWEAENEAPADAEDAPEATSDEVEEAEASSASEEDSDPAPAPEAKDETENLSARQLAALSRLEERLREKEEALKAREAELATPKKDDLSERLRRDPVSVIKELGLDAADTATLLWAAEMGVNAPEEFQKKLQAKTLESKVQALEERLSEREKEAQTASQKAIFDMRVAQLDEDIASFVESVPDDLPLLKRFAGKHPEDAYRELTIVAAESIRSGKWATPTQIARAYEKELQEYLGIFDDGKTASNTPAEKGKARQAKQRKTLSDADSAETPDRGSSDVPEEDRDDAYYQRRALRVLESL